MLARVVRFVENCQSPPDDRLRGPISSEDINSAEQYFIQLAQREEFKEEMKAIQSGKRIPTKSKLLPLRPFPDEEGAMRCEGRLTFADSLSWESRHPVILPHPYLHP